MLTCGNKDLRGFTNIGHKDDDYLTSSSIHACYIQIKNIRDEYVSTSNIHLLEVLQYLEKRYFRENKFSTYTTCGYNLKFDPIQNDTN